MTIQKRLEKLETAKNSNADSCNCHGACRVILPGDNQDKFLDNCEQCGKPFYKTIIVEYAHRET